MNSKPLFCLFSKKDNFHPAQRCPSKMSFALSAFAVSSCDLSSYLMYRIKKHLIEKTQEKW